MSNFRKNINKIKKTTAFSGVAVALLTLMSGCEQKDNNTFNMPQDSKSQGYFIVIQEVAQDKYKVVEQYPTNGTTRAILRKMDGTEELLSEEELKQLSQAEAQKVNEGTSRLTQEGGISSGGMSIGEAILESAGGAVIGSWIGNKLFNNPNYQKNVRRTTPTIKSPTRKSSSFSRSRSSGFMKKSPSRSRRSFSFGGSRFGG